MGKTNSSRLQMWHEGGKLCPKGTVPIRRSTVDDVLRAKSLYDFGKKSKNYDVSDDAGHEVPQIQHKEITLHQL